MKSYLLFFEGADLLGEPVFLAAAAAIPAFLRALARAWALRCFLQATFFFLYMGRKL